MGAKTENLNSVIENQDSDLNLQSALSHTMTRGMLRAFKTDVAAISHHCQGIARPKICAESPGMRLIQTAPGSGDLVQNSLQLVKVHWFNEVRIESRFFRVAEVFFRAETGDCDGLDRLFSPGLRDHFITASIGEADVAQEDVDFSRTQ